jgi:hypothetical protein
LLSVETVGGTSTLISQFVSIRDYTITTGGLYAYLTTGVSTRLSAVETLSGTSTLVSTIGTNAAATSIQGRLYNVETMAGSSTLISTIGTNAATSSIQGRLYNVETLAGTSTLISTIGTNTAATSIQGRLFNVETVAGTSTLTSQFISVRDYTITTGGLYSFLTGVNTRLSNVENVSGGSSLVSQFTTLQAYSNAGKTATGYFAMGQYPTLTTGAGAILDAPSSAYAEVQGWNFASSGSSLSLALQPKGGKVGVGNSAPSQALHVTGGVRASGASGYLGQTIVAFSARGPNSGYAQVASASPLIYNTAVMTQMGSGYSYTTGRWSLWV